MIRNKKLQLFIVSILVVWTLRAQNTEHVVVAVIDGARYTETFGDPKHLNIPCIWSQLRPLGTIYTAFSNQGLTETDPGHASIITGTWQKITNEGNEWPTNPTIFEYFRRQTNSDSLQCWVVLGKSKLNILSESSHPGYGHNYAASIKTSDDQYSDQKAWDNAGLILTEYHPRLTVINFPQIDSMAHQADWNGYISAIKRVDALVASLWNIIQSDSILCNKTTLIVTNDHGRHSYNYCNHGDGCEGCRHIMMLIVGPDTPAGAVDSLQHTQIDIAPTIGLLMGFNTPNSPGKVLQSAIITGNRTESILK